MYSLLLLVLLFIIHKGKPERHKTLAHILLGLLFFLLGLQHGGSQMRYPDDPAHIYNLIKTDQAVSLDGILLKYPSVISTSGVPETRFIIQVISVYRPAGQKPLMVKSARASGRVLLTLNGLLPADLRPGNRFLVRANLSRPSTYSTPGSFNYVKYLADQSIYIRGRVQSPGNVLKLHTADAALSSSFISTMAYLPERMRYNVAAALDKTLAQPARGLYKAVLIGDRNDVPASVLENFTGAGCIHILAISGMHMGLLAIVTIGTLTWLLKRSTWLLLHTSVRKIAGVIALLPLLLYALVAGFNIPVLRALLMTGIFILAILSDRPGNLLNNILLAAFLVLIWKPAAIFSASFQLSFSAVIAIALIYPLLQRSFFQKSLKAATPPVRQNSTESTLSLLFSQKISPFLLKWLMAGVALTSAAMLGTFPLLLYHFNRLSLVAPLANLLVEPLVCLWALILGLAASLCLPFLPAAAKILFIAGSFGLIIAEKICGFFTELPYATLWLPAPSTGEIILVYLALLSGIIAFHNSGRIRRNCLILSLFFCSSLVMVPAVTSIADPSSSSTSVTFLDVGHGSSILVRLPGNKNFLIDGGGAESDRFNIGERVVGPFLWKQRLRQLDAVIITHPHADHYNGLPFILKRFRPKELWINGMTGHDREYRELLNLADQLNIETRVAASGDILFQADSTRLLCIHGGAGSAGSGAGHMVNSSNNVNDSSLVLRLETGSSTFLFPADISAELAEVLVSDGKNLKADVLLAPHHGSPSSMSQDFIGFVAPEYITISAGRNNPFNFPAKSFHDLQQKGIEVLSTGRDGTISFSLDNEVLTVDSYRTN